MEEVMATETDHNCDFFLLATLDAHRLGDSSTGSPHHVISILRLRELRVELLGKMGRFRDQGEAICIAASSLDQAGKVKEAYSYYTRARELGAAHGFFSVECHACNGLGQLAMDDGRHEEGLDLLRNAHVASRLSEHADSSHAEVRDVDEQIVLLSLIHALFNTDAIDEVEPLVARYRELAQALSKRQGHLSWEEVTSCYYFAQLHEERGRPHEAGGEVRALLDLLRDNEGALEGILGNCRGMLEEASSRLMILDPELGDEELIQSVAAQLVKLQVLMRQP